MVGVLLVRVLAFSLGLFGCDPSCSFVAVADWRRIGRSGCMSWG